MNLEYVFSYCALLQTFGWLLLIIAPRWIWTNRAIWFLFVPVLGVLYLYLIISQHDKMAGGWSLPAGFNSLTSVAAYFQNPSLLLAGWLEFQALDLLIGGWEVRDAQNLRIFHGWVIVCLIMTWWSGPIGLLFYLATRITILCLRSGIRDLVTAIRMNPRIQKNATK